MTFDGVYIFGGYALKCSAPIPLARAMRERLPGIDGFRVFKLGMDSVTWACSGRILAPSKADLSRALWTGANYVLGQNLLTFTTTYDGPFSNCLLADFRQETPIQRTSGGQYTLRVQGTVVWAAPSLGDSGGFQLPGLQ